MAHVEDEQTHDSNGVIATAPETRRGSREPRPAPIQRAKWASSDPDQDGVTPDEYAKLLDVYDSSFRNIAEGEVMKGTVPKITGTDVIVDIGYKSEGIIPVTQFIDSTATSPSTSATSSMYCWRRNTEDYDGHIVLSKEKAEKVKNSGKTLNAQQHNENLIIRGRVIERIKGGLSVDIGVRAFLPGSQDPRAPGENLDSLCEARKSNAG